MPYKRAKIQDDVRFDRFDHFPVVSGNKRGRCKLDKAHYSNIKCSKCDIYLCINNKHNCFNDFHKK